MEKIVSIGIRWACRDMLSLYMTSVNVCQCMDVYVPVDRHTPPYITLSWTLVCLIYQLL